MGGPKNISRATPDPGEAASWERTTTARCSGRGPADVPASGSLGPLGRVFRFASSGRVPACSGAFRCSGRFPDAWASGQANYARRPSAQKPGNYPEARHRSSSVHNRCAKFI